MSRSSGKTIKAYEDINKYLFEHKVEHLAFIREGKVEILYTQKYVDKLQQRIDKAIEYIKNKARNNCWIDQYESCELIKILKGEDEET